jgi:site-specific DNA recombinase
LIRITRLEAQLTDSVADNFNIEPLWDKAISNLSQLDYLYKTRDVIQKRKIIGSMFPEKLTFDGFQYRTARVNEALNSIMLIDSKLKGKKKGQIRTFQICPIK